MKNKFKFIGIIAVIISIAILGTACPNDTLGSTARPVETTITVTGIPSRYIGFERRVGGWVTPTSIISGDSATFVFVGPGVYAVSLNLWDGRASVQYLASPRNINEGQNTIPFSYFLDNTLTITISGIPSQYNGWVGLLWLGNAAQSNPRVTDNSMTFAKVGSEWAGIRAIRLDINDDAGNRAGFRISSMNISAGSNSIQWSAFAEVPTISITSIPSQYHEINGAIFLRTPEIGWWDSFGSVQVHWVNDLASSVLWDAAPGVYDVFFSIGGTFAGSGLNIAEYFSFAREIEIGRNSIPFSAFIQQ